ncbi:MAG: hypothetical protein F6K56_19540 [Moorea sp. SIO3G5]|nr:hypothetical protein [Moorena sp. SIO3G5]
MALLNQGINISGVGILPGNCNGQDAHPTPDARSSKMPVPRQDAHSKKLLK